MAAAKNVSYERIGLKNKNEIFEIRKYQKI